MHKNIVLPYLLIGLILLVIISFLSFPYLSQWYFLSSGYLGLQKVSNQTGNLKTASCEFNQNLEGKDLVDLQASIQSLERAVEANSHSAQPFLLLGRAYCLQVKPDHAIEAFTRYSELRSKNPLGHIELALSYEAKCILETGSPGSTCENSTWLEKIRKELASAGVTEEMLINSGSQAFSASDYTGAFKHFRWASYLSNTPPSPTILYRWRLAAALIGETLPYPNVEPWEVFTLDGSLEVPATELRWQIQKPEFNLKIGDRLADHPGSNREYGVMWWRGSAIIVIDVKKPGIYQLVLSAQDTPPGPLQLQIEKDLKPVQLFELSAADGSWRELQTEVELTNGYHLIGVRFVEDRGDVILQWLRLNIVSSNSGD